jgi:hypothetical protein
MDINVKTCTLTVVGAVDPVSAIVLAVKKACLAAVIVSVEDDKPPVLEPTGEERRRGGAGRIPAAIVKMKRHLRAGMLATTGHARFQIAATTAEEDSGLRLLRRESGRCRLEERAPSSSHLFCHFSIHKLCCSDVIEIYNGNELENNHGFLSEQQQ